MKHSFRQSLWEIRRCDREKLLGARKGRKKYAERKEKNVNQKPTTTPSSERVILGIEDMSRTIGMALAGFGAIMLTALIWLYLRSKKA